jgi:hypothetical protein
MRTTIAGALALMALSLAAACAPRATDRPAPPAAGIEQDIQAARRAGPSAAARVVPPAGGSFAATAVPQGASPPQAAQGGTATAATAIGLGGSAGPGDPRIGRSFALANCRPCHVVSPDQGSPVRFANAPDLARIAAMRETTPLSLNVWLTNPHPTMPTLRLTPEEAANVIAYILSLRH